MRVELRLSKREAEAVLRCELSNGRGVIRSQTVARELCERCNERPATEMWGDPLTVIHGGGQRWCEPCCLEVQIAHAEERAAALPELRRRRSELTTTEEDAK